MAIRFYCIGCGQLLGIASRKAGTSIQCPKCGLDQTVPSEEAAAAAMAMSRLGVACRQPVPSSPPAGAAAYDDETSAIEAARPYGPGPAPPVLSARSQPPPPAPPTTPRTLPPGTILYRRTTLYVHGVLFLLLAAGAFTAGYLVGRGDATGGFRLAPKPPVEQRVLVQGKLYYDAAPGRIAPDADAVVIALPADRLPERTLSIQGLRPQDPAPSPTSESVRRIEELGGAYGRADDTGTFRIVLPRPGRYRVLFISRQSSRGPETKIDPLDLDEITKYFYRAADLIDRFKYRWTIEEVSLGSKALEHNFGRSGEPK